MTSALQFRPCIAFLLSGQLDTELQQLTLIIQQDLARLNELLRSLGMDPIESQQIITE